MRQAQIFSPGDAVILIGAQLFDAEMRADASESGAGDNFLEFGTFVFGETAEAEFFVADRRAQLDGLKAGIGKLFERAGKILGDHLLNGPGLAANGKAQGVRAEPEGAGSE